MTVRSLGRYPAMIAKVPAVFYNSTAFLFAMQALNTISRDFIQRFDQVSGCVFKCTHKYIEMLVRFYIVSVGYCMPVRNHLYIFKILDLIDFCIIFMFYNTQHKFNFTENKGYERKKTKFF